MTARTSLWLLLLLTNYLCVQTAGQEPTGIEFHHDTLRRIGGAGGGMRKLGQASGAPDEDWVVLVRKAGGAQ